MQKIFPTSAVRQLDAYTIEHEPIASIDLMERAAEAIAAELMDRWSNETPFVVFAGPGNNGGDALAVTRMMAQKGYRLSVYLFNVKDSLSEDCEQNKGKLHVFPEIDFHEVQSQFAPPVLTAQHVIIDALFGSGLNKPLTGGFASLVQFINASPARVVAIDVPSGLMGEDNTENTMTTVVRADFTLTLQFPKLSFLMPENAAFVGEWKVLDIGLHPDAIATTPTSYGLTELVDAHQLIKTRDIFAHKGDFGRALLIAGKQGMAGASILASKACLRSGVGLLTVHVPACNNPMVQMAVPEAMTSVDVHPQYFTDTPYTATYQAVGVGPGLGKEEDTLKAFGQLIETCDAPLVIDADALNMLSMERSLLGMLPRGSILTPHPGEMDRLVGKCPNHYVRLQKAIQLAQSTQSCIVLKGAYSAVIAPDGHCYFNTTGNPGMATGGSGDVLTGILLALLAQGYDSLSAARLGTCVHGLAGDIAADALGQISLTAGSLVEYLPQAWRIMSAEKYF